MTFNRYHVCLSSKLFILTFVISYFNAQGQIKTKDTTTLTIKRDTIKLQEVSIKGSKALIEKKIDRTVFNVGNSIAAKGTDLTQALALTPMLRVDGNSISIVGKSGVSVMINDRIVNLGGADLINYLKSLRSDDIDKIEVITTPPAKYEAQGNSGMINIVLKKNPSLGWSGSASATIAKTTYPAYANSLSLNFQSTKISSSLKIRQYHTQTNPTEEINVIGITSILSNDSRKDLGHGYGANLSTDYKVSKNANIGLIYDIGKSNYDMDINNTSIYKTNGRLDSVLRTVARSDNPVLSQTLNIYYDQKVGKNGSKISSGFNYFSTAPKTVFDFKTLSEERNATSAIRNNTAQEYNIWSAQSDLTLPYSWAMVESGLKFTNFDNNSDIGYFTSMNGNYQIDPSRSNEFIYNEKNMAAYLSLQKELHAKWTVKAGLRYEYAIVDGYTPIVGSHNKFQYGKLFPTVYLAYKPDADNTFSINYAKRINRPNFRALNPFRWYSNPYTYSTGNPILQPSYNHNVSLSYLYKGLLTLELYNQKLVNGYGRIVEVQNALKIVRYVNYLTQNNAGIEVSLAFKLFPWWENREFITYNFSSGKSVIPEVQLENGSAVYYSSYNTFTLSKSLNIFMNFWHSLPNTQGNVYTENRYSLSSGFRLALGSQFQLNGAVDDLLRSTVARGKVYYQDFTQTFNNYYDSRRFSLTATYTFGKSKIKGNKKQVNFKETQRAN